MIDLFDQLALERRNLLIQGFEGKTAFTSRDHPGVAFKDTHEVVALAEGFIDGPEHYAFQVILPDRPGHALLFGLFQPVAAPPYDGLASAVVPVDPAEQAAALVTIHDVRETMAGRISAGPPRCVLFALLPPGDLLLDQQEHFLGDDGLMISLDVILGHDALVLHPALRQKIPGVGLLKKRIAIVFLISEDLVHGAVVPSRPSRAG